MTTKRQLNALLRQDLHAFIHRTFYGVAGGGEFLDNWHLEAIAWHLRQCHERKIKRLVITMPPRSLKSISASVAFPAWVLGHDPTAKIVCISYAQDLALKHALDTRSVMSSAWYRKLFPRNRIDPARDTQAEIMTTARGFRLTTSVGGSLTGRGGNMFVIDDPHKADEALSEAGRDRVISWFRNTLLSRLDNKSEDVIIVVQQRLHEEDLAGYLLEQEGWVHVNLPAIAEQDVDVPIGPGRMHRRREGDVLHPAREPMAVLEQLQAQMGSLQFAAQYQQRPAPMDGDLVKWSWFRFYETPPPKAPDTLVVQSWDTANKAEQHNDYSVCITWLLKGKDHYLLHLYRARLAYPDLKKRILHMAEMHGANVVLIEDAGAGSSLLQDVQAERLNASVIGIQPEGDKQTRLMTVSPMVEAGRVHLPQEASWLAELQHELLVFPKGKHDDQVDSFSQYLGWARKRGTGDFLVMAVGELESARAYSDPLLNPTLGLPSPWDL